MKTALVTGATGYLGGVLAADLAHRGYRVLCPSRGEPGRAAWKARECHEGFGRTWDPDMADRIVEVPYDPAALESHPLLPEVAIAVHCAAEMSFSPLRLAESFDINLRGTMDWYGLIERKAAAPTRFIYLSTAYTGGIGEMRYPEAIHLAPRLLNPYQASKWAAELALRQRTADGGRLPVTALRPTLVIGHSRTGWYGGKSFGFYSYLDSVQAGKQAGAGELRFDADPEVAHDYLFIDTLLDDFGAILEKETARFSVAHSTGSRQPNAWRYAIVGREFGVRILLGKPETKADRIANKNQVFNEAFNKPGLVWDFETRHIAELNGGERRVAPLDEETFVRLIRWYREHRLA